MRLKYSKTLLEAQDFESPIADICWSPNNVKLAVATCERVVLLFDRDGQRRDKFSTKPADASAGKKSYVITALSFSENSELLGVAQSDNMVFVYRVGADWSGKKVICNKFPLTGVPMRLLPAESGFFTGTSDGKIRSLDCKSNKSSSIWSAGACCVSLARAEGSLASGHADGTLYVGGRLLLRYALPPTALVLLQPYLIVGSCDGRVAVYEAQRGTLLRSIEPQLPPDTRDLISAAPSPSGQNIAFGVFNGCLVGEMKESGAVELSLLSIPNLYAARAVAWSADGTRLAVASQAGALIQLEAVLRRWVWRDAVEVQHVSARRLLLTRVARDAAPLTVLTKHAPDIFNVRFIGNDWYAVCRTNSTLILCDIARGLTSEIPWAGGGERVYAAVGGACLIHRAGELSVVEYGLDKVLHTVRTERVNPHVLSVRINEGGAHRKHLAYLLDRQTVAVLDLLTGVQVGQWWHEARVDWLELNESGQLLLLRDTRRRLALLRLPSGDKEIIASGVGFVQWIENSDAVVAQTPTHLLVWYSAWDPGSVEMCETGGGVALEADARRVLLDGAHAQYLQLDEHRLAFNNALRSGDLTGCATYLDSVGSSADVAPLWRQLAERALQNEDVQLAAKCYREVGDEARTFYLDKTVQLAAAEGDGDVTAGLHSPVMRARLSIFAGNLSAAEECYVKRAARADLAIDMYKQFNKWAEAIAVAERADRGSVAILKQQYMDYLIYTAAVLGSKYSPKVIMIN
ncbi:hypothetical protein O3G_MSEX002174 [Manduca sexta]|uniref:Uncharacterized protein n=1 Tax=Manduca sexta TaxID=7130 RepID=A0A921YMY4_MANSE|nr:hypothetical protein O3G_MSEX002174 [Manduca sexta]